MDLGWSSVRISSLDRQIADSDGMLDEFEEKILSWVELMASLKYQRDELLKQRDDLRIELQRERELRDGLQKERDELKNERDGLQREREQLLSERERALTRADEIRTMCQEAVGSSQVPQFFSKITSTEIERATLNLDPSKKISEGGNGRSVYRGQLRNTQVAIKMFGSDTLQDRNEFQREVDVLSKVRHPNIVSLIGVCPEDYFLVYEYLPNGSLEDRLNCRNNTPPLPWQVRTRIAADICSALIFLHSNNPNRIVHGGLKPDNILMDENFVSKLRGFSNSCLIPYNGRSARTSTPCRRIDPIIRDYIDPEFLATEELTPASDVYSFGIILLLLLTGGPALGIVQMVKSALDTDTFHEILDESAGKWPLLQAKQLAHWALRCCEQMRQRRPDLGSDVSIVLERLKFSCGASSSNHQRSEAHGEIPLHFICPIFQEIMQDPHVAADGHTYEREALKRWLDTGHDTSPMTNLRLQHRNLIPNYALRAAIQEWLQQS